MLMSSSTHQAEITENATTQGWFVYFQIRQRALRNAFFLSRRLISMQD
jgi:hypothetical protein